MIAMSAPGTPYNEYLAQQTKGGVCPNYSNLLK